MICSYTRDRIIFYLIVLFVLADCSNVAGLKPVYPQPQTVRGYSGGAFLEVDSLQPTFRWESFPRPEDLRKDENGMLGRIQNVTYDLKIWRTQDESVFEASPTRQRFPKPLQRPLQTPIYYRQGLPKPLHKIEEPLEPSTKYIWSVRARFEVDGATRVIPWAGIWPSRAYQRMPLVPNNPIYYHFKTPRSDLRREVKLHHEEELLGERETHEHYPYGTSVVLFDERRIDKLITSLESYCARNPSDIEANILLAKVYLEKCTFLKKSGNEYYKTVLSRPWNTAKRLYKETGGYSIYRSDLYYIFARTYFIKDKPKKAIKYAKIAIEASPPDFPNIDCMLLLGDSYAALAENETSKYYSTAQKTYQEINNLNVSDDHKALAYYKLGVLYVRLKKTEKAREALHSAQKLVQNDSMIKEIHSLLDSIEN
jgi:hypothetical protein